MKGAFRDTQECTNPKASAALWGFLLEHSLLTAVPSNVTLNFIQKKIIYYLIRPLSHVTLAITQEHRTAISLNFILFKKSNQSI